MSEWHVAIMPQARDQIVRISIYLRDELFMPQAARSFFDEMMSSIQGLSSMPSRFHLVDAEPLRSAGVRRMNVKRYSVYYRVHENERALAVLAVLHGSVPEERLGRILR